VRSPEDSQTTRRNPAAGRGATFVVPLDAATWPLRDLVGGKAHGLRELVQQGFRVPPGFVVTTEAFDGVVEDAAQTASDVGSLAEAVRAADLPEMLVREVTEALGLLDGPWAVRSSATIEDGEHASWAGQGHTELHCEGPEEVLRAIKEVWAHHFTPEALSYLARQPVDAMPPRMAVVVQQMIAPRAAGVLFTKNPVGASNEAVISAAYGLGTTVVDGEDCDTYYTERPSGYTLRQELSGDKPVLSAGEREQLTRIAEVAERGFARPMDIEWALVDDAFMLVQARPITTSHGDDAPTEAWTNANVGEALPGVGTPLTWSIIRGFSRRGFTTAFGALGLDVPPEYELVGSFRGRVYLNLSQFMSIASAIPVLEPETLYAMAGGGGVDLVRDIYNERSPAAFLARLPVTIPRIAASQLAIPAVTPLWDTYVRHRRDEFFSRDLSRLDDTGLREALADVDQLFDYNGLVMLACSSNFLMSYAVTREFLRNFGTPEALARDPELMGGLDVQSSEPGLRMVELAQIARRSRRLRRLLRDTPLSDMVPTLRDNAEHHDVALFLEEFDAFVAAYGHRAPREAELATPRWREDPTFVFEVIRGFLDVPHLPGPRERARDRKAAKRRMHGLIENAFVPGLRAAFLAVLKFTRDNARRREVLRARVVDTLSMYRAIFLECGRRMARSGAIARAEDAFYLTYDEIHDWIDDARMARGYRLRVIARRAVVEAFRSQPDPPDVFVLRGSEMISEVRGTGVTGELPDGVYTEITGLAASPGRVTGKARVIRDPEQDATVEPGEVLIVPYADIGWTPLFLNASAVVMALGGPLSHAAIVAREYGLPAVVSARGILEQVETGDTVTVDGTRGLVFVRE
jgi:pyruvate,water dikinase